MLLHSASKNIAIERYVVHSEALILLSYSIQTTNSQLTVVLQIQWHTKHCLVVQELLTEINIMKFIKNGTCSEKEPLLDSQP